MIHKVGTEQLELMRSKVGYLTDAWYDYSDVWYAYENQAMDSSTRGEMQFLLVGPDRTHKTPPPHMPDTNMGPGWKWRLIGSVSLETGKVTSMETR